MHDPAFKTNIFEVEIAGKENSALWRWMCSLDPVSDQPVHADFRRIEKDTLVRVPIPVRFLNEGAAPGIKVGGVLNIVRHEMEVRGRPDDLPGPLDIDLTGLEIGDACTSTASRCPRASSSTIARNFTVCTIAPPTVMRRWKKHRRLPLPQPRALPQRQPLGLPVPHPELRNPLMLFPRLVPGGIGLPSISARCTAS